MTKKIILILVCIIITGLSLNAQAQGFKAFSKTPETYLTELTDYYLADKNLDKNTQKKWEEIIIQYTALWNSDLSAEQKAQMINISNGLLNIKVRTAGFYDFLRIQLLMNKQQINAQSKAGWHKSLEYIITVKKLNYFETMKDATLLLLEEGCIYKESNCRWQPRILNYNFVCNEQPQIVFGNTDLVGYTIKDRDSMIISHTGGIYYPLEQTWKGKGGEVDWQRAGFSPNEARAELHAYTVDLKNPSLKADSVLFHFPKYFAKPLLGSLEDKANAEFNAENVIYPRFVSYEGNIPIKEVYKDVDYRGGFSVKGNKIYGQGVAGNAASLFFKKNGKTLAKVSSGLLVMGQERAVSSMASVTLWVGNDSIFHSGLEFKYTTPKRELSLSINKESGFEGPFSDSYHKINIYVDGLTWNLDESEIKFVKNGIPGTVSTARFESVNFFTPVEYDKMRGIDETHPLTRVRRCSDYYQGEPFTVSDFATFAKLDLTNAKRMIINLTNQGFLIYEQGTEKITPKEKLNIFVEAAMKRMDYDRINFTSDIILAQSSTINASFNVDNKDLLIRGLIMLTLSDSQNVHIVPDKHEIIMKKNRDMVFSGQVEVGKFKFYSHSSYFSYSDFTLNLPEIDSLNFAVKSFQPNEKGLYYLAKVQSTIEGLTGSIQIDKPDNKSGLKDYPDYPIFTSKSDSYVYYDQYMNGLYPRKTFFFRINPFVLKSLDDFKTENLTFAGSLVSAGIYADIPENLKVQKDYSLGFLRKELKTPVYGGRGNFTNDLYLSNSGLRGGGDLQYESAIATSKNVFFTPDSTLAIAQVFKITEQAQKDIPTVDGADVLVKWFPYQNNMAVTNRNQPFNMYGKNVKLDGGLAVSSSGLTGSGTAEFERASLISNNYKFTKKFLDSDTTSFKLKTFDLKEMAFSTENYKAHIDFEKRKGDFTSNGGIARVNFPIIQYNTYMQTFEWLMDQEQIAVKPTKGEDITPFTKMDPADLLAQKLPGTLYVSSHKDQDMLKFVSPRAVYDLKENTLSAEDVFLIRVADAAVFPADRKVVVKRQAEMDPFTKALVIADTANKFHKLYDADVIVKSRKSYIANASYDYVDELKEKQKVSFNNIYTEESATVGGFITKGEGVIRSEQNFKLSPAFDFYGNIKLSGPRKNLVFEGATQIKNPCQMGDTASYWLKFNGVVNPDTIRIPVATPIRSIDGRSLAVGIGYYKAGIYPAFLSAKRGSDSLIISADGFLTYDKGSKEYRISSLKKLKGNTQGAEDYVALNTQHCSIYGEGNIRLATRAGAFVVKSVGNVKENIENEELLFNLTMGFNFHFNDDAMKYFMNRIRNYNGREVSKDVETYPKFIQSVVGEDNSEKLLSEITNYGQIRKYPDELDFSLLFSDVKMKWNAPSRSFVSFGEIGLGSIHKTYVGKYSKGAIQVIKNTGGDVVNIYIELSPSEWYMFRYQSNVMSVYSPDKKFMDFIIEAKPKDRRQEASEGRPTFTYAVGTERMKMDFLRKIEAMSAETEDNSEESTQTE